MNTESSAPSENNDAATSSRPLRIWIPVVLLAAMPAISYLPLKLDDPPQAMMFIAAAGPALMSILILVWWLTVSRASWRESLFGLLGVVAAIGLTLAVADESMQDVTAMALLTVPMGMVGFAIGLILLRKSSPLLRTSFAVALAAVGFGYSALQRNDGMWGNYGLELGWRWNPSAEAKLVSAESSSPKIVVSEDQIEQWIAQPHWSQFRGADRSGRYDGPAIDTDWSANPPELQWRIPVGPGWSSFAVAGELLFTQEQRGDLESIVCYSTETGQEIWIQQIESRFEESLGGPGPRATPTIASGALFVLGANGQLMRLNPTNGEIVWQSDLREIADRQPPDWGFSSSPLVVDSLVVVHAGGEGDKGVLAFDIESGDLVWSAPAGDHSYSSPQLAELAGEQHIVMLTNHGLTLLDPKTGATRLTYPWDHMGYRSLQPQVVDGDSILLPTGIGTGTRRIHVSKNDSDWSAEEEWTSRFLKPDFNDSVVHDGYIYGFDQTTFTCVDLATGERIWKRGRYGAGQVLLLAQSGTLLVISERGSLVLVKADPAGHRELGKLDAIQGKTWNHPVVVGDRLYVRNGQEAACYRLLLADTGGQDTDTQDTTDSTGKRRDLN